MTKDRFKKGKRFYIEVNKECYRYVVESIGEYGVTGTRINDSGKREFRFFFFEDLENNKSLCINKNFTL